MLDPGALGTLVIGLESVRREQELDARDLPRPVQPARRPRQMRHGVAAILRRTAELIEPAQLAAR